MSYPKSNRGLRHLGLALCTATLASCSVSATTLPESTNDSATEAASDPSTTATPEALGAPEANPTDPTSASTTTAPEPDAQPPDSIDATPTEPTTSDIETLPPTPPETTLAPLPDDVHDADCVVRAPSAGSLELLAATQPAIQPGPDILFALWVENGFAESVEADALVDVCIGNGVDDIDGTPVPSLDDPIVIAARNANVVRQQEKLNELFAPFAPRGIDVDGISGPRTGQRLCGARLALGIGASITDMAPGSQEQAVLFAADVLPTPMSNANQSERWVLIDRACQLMFVGTGSDLTFVFNTSTGSAGFETRLQDRASAFRFNPAVDNGGWHDSSEFPVGVDNPLNGNMYKPLYFDLGQAIHGANSVPPIPDSKGCARLSVADQDAFVAWLGLADAPEETWRRNEMNVTVSVQGEFIER